MYENQSWDNIYHFYHYPKNSFDCLIDIGASVGQVTIPFLERNPDAVVLCVEPCIHNISVLKDRLKKIEKDAIILEGALGTGEILHFTRYGGVSKNYTSEDGNGELIASYTLKEIMKLVDHISGTKMLTIDVEGGESVLLNDQESEECLSSIDHIGIEVHYPNGSKRYQHFSSNPTLNEYYLWIHTKFSDSHYIFFNNLCPTSGLGIFIMKKKEKQ